MEDSKIIDLFFERSELAITELSKKYGSLCAKIANNILNSRLDTEECVNDAFLAVWNSVPPQNPSPLSSYVCRIVRNLAIKRYHSNTAQKRNSAYDVALDEIDEYVSSSTSLDTELDARKTAAVIDAFLETLDKDNRVLFVRRYWFSDSIDNLAKLFDTSKHNISVRLSRIRKKLKKYLIREGVSL